MTPLVLAVGGMAALGIGWAALWLWALGPRPPALTEADVDKITEGWR